jgi:hypothetical protein
MLAGFSKIADFSASLEATPMREKRAMFLESNDGSAAARPKSQGAGADEGASHLGDK